MTPSDIEVLLHIHVCPEPHPRESAPAVDAGITRLLGTGLIEPLAVGKYHTTDRGAAHIRQLCQLPFPTVQWVGANGEIIDS